MPKPLPILPQMPWNVKKMIVDSANSETKLTIRPCSKEFKDLVNGCQIRYQKLSLEIKVSKAVVKFYPYWECKMMIKYIQNENGYEVDHEGNRNLVTDGNFIAAAVNQFVKVLRDPKVLIKKFTVQNYVLNGLEDQVLHDLHSIFSSLAHPVRVQDLTVLCNTQNDMMKILHYIQPGTLKYIHFYDTCGNIDIDLSELAGTQHWKLARHLDIDTFNMTLPVEKWSHFTWIRVRMSDLTLDKMKAIFNSFLNARQWWWCEISIEDLVEQPFIDYFKQLGTYKYEGFGGYKFSIPIPNSRKKVKVCIDDDSISLEK